MSRVLSKFDIALFSAADRLIYQKFMLYAPSMADEFIGDMASAYVNNIVNREFITKTFKSVLSRLGVSTAGMMFNYYFGRYIHFSTIKNLFGKNYSEIDINDLMKLPQQKTVVSFIPALLISKIPFKTVQGAVGASKWIKDKGYNYVYYNNSIEDQASFVYSNGEYYYFAPNIPFDNIAKKFNLISVGPSLINYIAENDYTLEQVKKFVHKKVYEYFQVYFGSITVNIAGHVSEKFLVNEVKKTKNGFNFKITSNKNSITSGSKAYFEDVVKDRLLKSIEGEPYEYALNIPNKYEINVEIKIYGKSNNKK